MTSRFIYSCAQLSDQITQWLFEVANGKDIANQIIENETEAISSNEDEINKNVQVFTLDKKENQNPVELETQSNLSQAVAEERDLLIQDCVDLMNEMDGFISQEDENSSQIIEHLLNRFEDILERNNVQRIEKELEFNNIRHRSFETGKRIPQGALILETLRPGYILNNRVIRRALVRVNCDQTLQA
jgi:molecular chaperone GrpE (heat shock protein)